MSSTTPVPGPAAAALLERRAWADLAAFAARFIQVGDRYGAEAGESLLGGYVEWLGVDLVDALVVLPADRGRRLDALAEAFLQAARAWLQEGSAAHWAGLVAVVGECAARAVGAEGMQAPGT